MSRIREPAHIEPDALSSSIEDSKGQQVLDAVNSSTTSDVVSHRLPLNISSSATYKGADYNASRGTRLRPDLGQLPEAHIHQQSV